MKNLIQFKNKFINVPQYNENNLNMAMSVVSELMQFGYILSSDAIQHLASSNKENITKFHNDIITYLKDMTGYSRSYKPFWKNFPNDVMEKSETELFLHQIVHYMSCGTYEPNDTIQKRISAFEQPSYTVINVGNDTMFNNIFTMLCSVNQSLPQSDKDDIIWFINSNQKLIINDIPFKENLCIIITELYKSSRTDIIYPKLTVTDVLRIAVYMSGGNIALPKVPSKLTRTSAWSRTLVENTQRENFKFKNFKRSERRFILSLLEKTSCDVKEGVLKYNRFIRLGEKIHPMEFKNKYPKSYEFFYKLRNENIVSWYGDVNKEFNISLKNGLTKLSERSGEFVRRVDALIRTHDKGIVYEYFRNIVKKASNKTLYELYLHFSKRNQYYQRTIMIKGSRKITTLPSLKPLDNDIIKKVKNIIIETLSYKFSLLPSMGKCYISEDLKYIPLPTNLRSVNTSLKPIIRGQRVKIGNGNMKVLRAYVHWFDEHSNQDIDLSAFFITKNNIEHLSFNTHMKSTFGYHSGDVRFKQGACAEYIDINIDYCKKNVSYCLFMVNNFKGYPLKDVPECLFGYMEREFPQENEVFLPQTISNSIKVQSDCSNSILIAIDFSTMEYIYIDVDYNGIPVSSGNVKSTLDILNKYIQPSEFSVYDMMKIHIEKRGSMVSKNEADTIFDTEYFDNYVKILNYMGI